MSDFVDGLRTVERLADAIQQDSDLNAQQTLFIQHISRTALRLANLLTPIPDSSLAYQTIVPHMADEILEPMAVIYGYARMLIDQPQSFGHAFLTSQAIDHAENIYSLGRGIARDIETLTKTSFEMRLEARRAKPSMTDVVTLIQDYMPIWQYELRATQTEIRLIPPTSTVPSVSIRAYHLIEFLRHILIISTHEIVDPCNWHLSFYIVEQDRLQLRLQSDSFQLTDEHLFVLFEKQGRHIFRELVTRVPMQFLVAQEITDGTTFFVQFEPTV